MTQRRPSCLDRNAHAGALVGRKVVHHDDVAGQKSRNEDLLDIGQERWPVHGPVEDHRRCHAGQAQTSRGRGSFPVSVWDGGPAALTAFGAATEAGHLGRGARLLDEDQLFGVEVEVELTVEPGLTRFKNVLALLLCCVRGFF